MTIGLTLVLPAYNEGLSIKKTLIEIDQVALSNIDLTIYVSEDGSTDNTRSEVLQASKDAFNARIILSEKSERLGYSRGVIRGIRECKTQFIGFMDADGQCDPTNLDNLTKYLSENTIVVGYRNPRNDSLARIAYSKAFKIAYLAFGGPKLKDPSSPFILCNTADISSLANITPKLAYGFWWEFQIRMKHAGKKIIEIPVNHRTRQSGMTQVYRINKLPNIVITHFFGLIKLRKELKNMKIN